jgi:GlpG protein
MTEPRGGPSPSDAGGPAPSGRRGPTPPGAGGTGKAPRIWDYAPVTFAIALLCGVLFLATALRPELLSNGALIPEKVWSGEWWRLLTSVFLHFGFIHVAFNVAWWIHLGSGIELRYGSAILLLLTLVTGLAGGAAELATASAKLHVQIQAAGLSGAVYGLFFFGFVALRHLPGGYRLLFSKGNALFLTGWGVLCIFFTWFGVLHVANWAHGIGAVSGALAGVVVRGRGVARQAGLLAFIAGLGLLLFAAMNPVWLTRYVAWDGTRALVEGRTEVAIAQLRAVHARQPENAWARAVLAVALAQDGQMDEAEGLVQSLDRADRAQLRPELARLLEDAFGPPAED